MSFSYKWADSRGDASNSISVSSKRIKFIMSVLYYLFPPYVRVCSCSIVFYSFSRTNVKHLYNVSNPPPPPSIVAIVEGRDYQDRKNCRHIYHEDEKRGYIFKFKRALLSRVFSERARTLLRTRHLGINRWDKFDTIASVDLSHLSLTITRKLLFEIRTWRREIGESIRTLEVVRYKGVYRRRSIKARLRAIRSTDRTKFVCARAYVSTNLSFINLSGKIIAWIFPIGGPPKINPREVTRAKISRFLNRYRPTCPDISDLISILIGLVEYWYNTRFAVEEATFIRSFFQGTHTHNHSKNNCVINKLGRDEQSMSDEIIIVSQINFRAYKFFQTINIFITYGGTKSYIQLQCRMFFCPHPLFLSCFIS